MKYSTTGKCWGVAPKAGGGRGYPPSVASRVSGGYSGATALPGVAKGTARPKSSRERRAMKKGK